jgi:hypothetical protein
MIYRQDFLDRVLILWTIFCYMTFLLTLFQVVMDLLFLD